MSKRRAHVLLMVIVLLGGRLTQAQSPEALVRQVVETERTANGNDHLNWIYFEESRRAKEHTLEWVAATRKGEIRRVVQRDDRGLPEAEQREEIERFLHDPKAQRREVEEGEHDARQIDDLLKLLPEAFHWTETGGNASSTSLHFEPNAEFHPPTRGRGSSAGWRVTSWSITSSIGSAA